MAAAEPLETFCYGRQELVLRGAEWRSSPALSRFDRALQRGWDDRLRRGLFRYRLGDLRTRLLPGSMGLVAQLNPQRATQRRRPQEVRSVQQAFDPQQFHFGKIQREEALFRLAERCPAGAGPPPGALVVINVSPLEFGHVLLVPDPALSLPQILTPEALRLGLDAVLLSAHPGFRVGFNSLGAFASVNHLHLHGFYLNWELLVESAPCQPLLPEAGFYLLPGVPAPGFLFYSDGQRLGLLTRRITRVTRYLSQREIAHNLFATRGAAPEGPLGSKARPGLRIILWARKACFGTKEELAFNVAVCELAGYLPTKSPQEYEALTEASAIHRIQECLLSDTQLARLQRELVDLLRE